VNNCATDQSLAVAQAYAARDPRIRIVNNDRPLSVVENQNHTLRQLSAASKYCKMVFADDWIYPASIEEMVREAERYPSVGLVCGYTTDGRAVLWQAPSRQTNPVPGREVCRSILMGGPYLMGSMTSLLLRSDLVRKRPAFFDHQNPHREVAACFETLLQSDFAYIRQVLSFSRPKNGPTEQFARDFDINTLGALTVFLKYGRQFLTPAEYAPRSKVLFRNYHSNLAACLLRHSRRKEFWKFHQDTLQAFGGRIDGMLLAACAAVKVLKRLSNPLHTIRHALRGSGALGQQA
jgi:glycosyltransferase involved in cell wall biosynthesis